MTFALLKQFAGVCPLNNKTEAEQAFVAKNFPKYIIFCIFCFLPDIAQ